MPTTDADKLPYFKINKFLWRWTACHGEEGCEIVREASLSMDKVPPLPKQVDATPVQRKPAAKSREHDNPLIQMVDGIDKMANAFSRFKTWLDTPDPPKAPRPASVVTQQKKQVVPPFDLQEIPGAMRKEHMPIAAKLMERWFAGELNYSPTDKDQAAEINQKGQPYPESMVDRTTIKLDWVLKHARAKEQYEELVNTLIFSSAIGEVQ